MRRSWKQGCLLLLLLGAAILVTGCFLPQGWQDSDGGSQEATGSIEVNLHGLEANSLVPDIPALVDEYRVTATRSGYDDVVVTNSTSPVSVPNLAIGSWTIVVEAIDADNSDAVVGVSSPETVVVTSGGVASLTVTVTPTTGGTGDLDLTVTWPSSESLTVGSFALTADGGSDVSSSITQGPVTDGVSLSTSGGTLSAGSYTMILQLQRGGVDVATVIEAVQIYDNVTTTAAINLAAEEIGDAPLAPTDLTVTEESGQVALNWTDASNTELRYIVERSSDGGSSWTVLDGALPPGTATYTDATRIVGTTYTYRVSAENDFGSPSASTTVTVLGSEEITISLDVSEPTEPTISFGGTAAQLDLAIGETLSITATGGTFTSVVWYLNGSTTYPDGSTALDSDSSDDTLFIDSAQISRAGTYSVTALVTTGAGESFSASFSFDIIANHEDLALTLVVEEPTAEAIDFDFGAFSGDELDRALGESLTVTATGASFDSVTWYLDGNTSYPGGSVDLDADSGDATVTIDSAELSELRRYTVTALATIGGSRYSAAFSFNLVAAYEDVAIELVVDEPQDQIVELTGLDTAAGLGSARTVTATSGYTGGYSWYINGVTTYPDSSNFSTSTTTTSGDTLTVDTSKLSAGTHSVTVVAKDSSGRKYSTQRTLTIEN